MNNFPANQEPKNLEKDVNIDHAKNTLLTHVRKYENIFTKNEIDLIYNTIDLTSNENTTEVRIYGQKAWFTNLPEEIKNRVAQQMKIIHNQDLKLEEISFARYSNKYSNTPILTPHYDNAFRQPRVTLDVQLKSNINWPIVVEGKEIQLGDNDAVTFSGTHQIHWRAPLEFKDGDFIDMLFCHFSLKDSMPITLNEKEKIESKMMRFSSEFASRLMRENTYLKQLVRKYTNE